MSFPVFDILARRADLGPHRVAMEDIVNDNRVTYQELNQRTGRTTALLASLGVAQGDRVTLLCRNRERQLGKIRLRDGQRAIESS